MASVSAEVDASPRSIPIIAVTSYALSGEGKKARVAGCDAEQEFFADGIAERLPPTALLFLAAPGT